MELGPGYLPSKVVCIGRNYSDHAKELGNQVPEAPMLFLKAPSAIIFDNEPIVLPRLSDQVEHEAELAVVIDRRCKDIGDEENPFSYVRGFTCLNDVTARDLQRKDGQFARAKSFDTFCPIGPELAAGLDVSDLAVVCRVNGEVRQSGRTAEMVFPVDYLIRYISKMMTLMPGDLIATGTPSGVSRLSHGDVCEVEIEGIGVLTNPVVGS
ncbi:MAG TPA: fumarylacetoacetate hydrolase family protein [Pyrinomonadaceae bacterium]|nr:fumarylacetoacetate hydrolase family protein [Pyrinomonadaceae bacterium]